MIVTQKIKSNEFDRKERYTSGTLCKLQLDCIIKPKIKRKVQSDSPKQLDFESKINFKLTFV